MATDATGTPTTSLGIPKYNTAADIPSGKGFNAAMDWIDDLIEARSTAVPGASGVKVWNNTTKAWETPAGATGTKFLRDDGTFAVPAGTSAPLTGRINLDGTIAGGTGFTVSKPAVGTYTITYATAYAVIPVVNVQVIQAVTKSTAPILSAGAAASFQVLIFDTTVANLGTLLDQGFQFHVHAVT